MDDDLPDPGSGPDSTGPTAPVRLPHPVARLSHLDEVTVMEVTVRGDRILLHEVSAYDPGLVTGCSAVTLGYRPAELLTFLVSYGYVDDRNALAVLDALDRGLPERSLTREAQRLVELISAIESEVERQQCEAPREGDEHDA